MELTNGWTVVSKTELLLIKIFKNMQNENEFVIRDKNDTGALCSFIISENDIEILEISWSISLQIDWKDKKIFIKDSQQIQSDI